MLTLLDQGLDEMAAGTRATFAPRIAALIAVGLIALAFLPWPVCVAWIALAGGVDAFSWFATREQAAGGPVSTRARVSHAASLVIGVTAWVALSVLFWRTGTAGGAICAVVLWFALIGFAQVYAYQSRAGYLLAGVTPAAGMLIIPLTMPNAAIPGIWPVWLLMAVSIGFAAASARQTVEARRRYEQALQDLRESELSYRLLADNVSDVIMLIAEDGQRLYVSPSVERVLGFTAGKLIENPTFGFLHPDDAEAVLAFVSRVTETSGPQTLEYRAIKEDGSVMWADTTFSRLSDGSRRVLAVSRDVTHRKSLEGELKEAVARSEAAAAAKTDFLANMTHELRTPLTAIIGFSGVLRQSIGLSERDARHVGLIHDASKTLLGVVGDVLDFSKLEAGGFELDPEPFEPAAMARSAAAMVAEQAAEKGLVLTANIDEAAVALIGDAPRLRQVLLNFLSNAVKFTREGGVTLTLTNRLDAERSRLRIEVADSGIGIDEEHIGALFTRFTQADASVSRQFGGTGLGLAISKQIIEAMGGRIGADSVVGQGSTFWFEVDLPRAEEWAATAEPEGAAEALDRPIRALIVEDNAVNRELITTLLSPFGLDIDTACDGAEAMEAVGRRRYDVILMDMQMPVMDGLTATRRIRALTDREVAGTPIIAMTANVLPEQVARCREAGMDDHLGKPIDLPRLLAAIDRWSTPGARDEAADQADRAAG